MSDQAPTQQDTGQPRSGATASNAIQPINTPAAEPTAAQQLAAVEKEMSGFEKSTLKWARTAVIMSGLAAIFVCLQWWEMHTGSADTHNLAVAAGKQADRMKDQGERTKDLADRMKDQADRTKELADQAAIQSKESIVAATAARETANTFKETLRKSQRPWVNAESFTPTSLTTPPEGRLEVWGDLVIRNTGTSVATDGWAQMVVAPNNSKWLTSNWDKACHVVDESARASHDTAAKGMGDVWPIGFVLAPNQETKMRMGGGDADGIIGQQITKALPYSTPTQDARSGQFYLLGCARYKDQFGTNHTTRFCFIYLNDKMSPSGFYVCNGMQTSD